MAIPPPLPGDGLQPGQDDITRKGKRRSPKKSGGNTWLIAGCVLAGLLLIAAVLLYFLSDLFSSKDHDYDDGNRNERVLRQNDDEDSEDLRKIADREQETEIQITPAHKLPIALHGRGLNGEGPTSIDMNIDADGNISGTYWNIFGNIEFNLTGRQTADGSLEMNMTTVKDNVSTSLTLHTTDGITYTGKWGKKQQPVEVTLHEGHARPLPAPNVVSRWHIKGPHPLATINDDVCISEENGTYYFWYVGQGYGNRLRMTSSNYGFSLYNSRGDCLATIIDNGDGTATMTDSRGQTFSVTIIE